MSGAPPRRCGKKVSRATLSPPVIHRVRFLFGQRVAARRELLADDLALAV